MLSTAWPIAIYDRKNSDIVSLSKHMKVTLSFTGTATEDQMWSRERAKSSREAKLIKDTTCFVCLPDPDPQIWNMHINTGELLSSVWFHLHHFFYFESRSVISAIYTQPKDATMANMYNTWTKFRLWIWQEPPYNLILKSPADMRQDVYNGYI